MTQEVSIKSWPIGRIVYSYLMFGIPIPMDRLNQLFLLDYTKNIGGLLPSAVDSRVEFCFE